ncbi:low-specificity L-threonine aldolase [Coralloluteibacterium stylophorae]|uniref:Low-specificity L-threonine aldolase n=1 Tax=Coralloluteibacterium stylophorae TaxID=1776034 RepID=A0A8J8AWS9_9GAMM|nr:low-specificity L-threonine aldolase [Coralloluteibacterium stylophorae]MBS7457059.1 low-specificity L-threonine aldolase [Coralloluteibacterium stylophorae]
MDFRSDTVTRPTRAMREAMSAAEVGDDVYREDPTVAALERRLAAEAGLEAGLFVPSGTQSNLLALMSHCERGDEYLVGMDAHAYRYEGGGAAVLGAIQPQPIPQGTDGRIPLDVAAAMIKPLDPHFARTRLLCLENTWHGRVLPLDYLAEAAGFRTRHRLALHLDGARVFNAAVALGVPLREITRHVDSVSICLSKGLGAPVGSVLLGAAGFIERARRWRKVAGGGWRQAGLLAAAGLHALDHHVARLADDHRRAAWLAAGLRDAPGLAVTAQHTNMVFIELPAERLEAFRAHVEAHGLRLSVGTLPQIRLVTHLDIDDAAVERSVAVLRAFDAG